MARAKGVKAPQRWSAFLQFVSINKTIPRSVLSRITIRELDQFDNYRVKKAKLSVPIPPFFETLFPDTAAPIKHV